MSLLIVDGFNDILDSFEHRGGDFLNYAIKSLHFNNVISNNQLLDHDFCGPKFTWSNNHSGLAKRWARLDKFLANFASASTFTSYKKNYHPRTHFDHALIYLNAYCFDNLGFHNFVIKTWD